MEYSSPLDRDEESQGLLQHQQQTVQLDLNIDEPAQPYKTLRTEEDVGIHEDIEISFDKHQYMEQKQQ